MIRRSLGKIALIVGHHAQVIECLGLAPVVATPAAQAQGPFVIGPSFAKVPLQAVYRSQAI